MPKPSRPSSLDLRLDRSLPVSIHAQLVGQIAYGVSCGLLPPGHRLPSVRELADHLRISPVTVSHAYRTLRERALIEARPGRGTFVAHAAQDDGSARERLPALQRAVDSLIATSDRLGAGRDELAGLVSLRLNQEPRPGSTRVMLVGTFDAATRDYAAEIQQHFGSSIVVDATTFAELERGRGADALASADLALTFPHRRHELTRHLRQGAPSAVVEFIPSEQTRTSLAAISPLARVLLVSVFPEFLPIFKEGVERFAPHLHRVVATMGDAADLDRLISESDVVIHATGADAVRRRVRPGVRVFEYRHAPDPVSLDAYVAPILERLRGHGARERDSHAAKEAT